MCSVRCCSESGGWRRCRVLYAFFALRDKAFRDRLRLRRFFFYLQGSPRANSSEQLSKVFLRTSEIFKEGGGGEREH